MMTTYVSANFVSTTLSSALSTSGTILTVASSANLPVLTAGEIMPIVLTSAANQTITEICYVTAISGTSLTVTRAQEGTGALAWNVGDYVMCDFTAGTTEPAGGSPSIPFQVQTVSQGDNSTNAASTAWAIRNGVRYSGYLGVTSNTTLTMANAGQFIQFNGAATYSATLPGSSTAGLTYAFYNDTPTIQNIVAPTGNFIYWSAVGTSNTLTTFPLGSGQRCTIVDRGSGEYDIVNFASAPNAPKMGQSTFTTSQTLGLAQNGQIVFFAGSTAATFTLPSAAIISGHQCVFTISNQGTAPLTIVPQSGQAVDLNPAILQPNQTATVANDGTANWHHLSSEAGSTSPFAVGNAVSAGQAVNQGQTFLSATVNNVTASRALGTTYTNTTSKAMFVSASVGALLTVGVYFYINGILVSQTVSGDASSGFDFNISGIVPPGSTYEVTAGGGSVLSWTETY